MHFESNMNRSMDTSLNTHLKQNCKQIYFSLWIFYKSLSFYIVFHTCFSFILLLFYNYNDHTNTPPRLNAPSVPRPRGESSWGIQCQPALKAALTAGWPEASGELPPLSPDCWLQVRGGFREITVPQHSTDTGGGAGGGADWRPSQRVRPEHGSEDQCWENTECTLPISEYTW